MQAADEPSTCFDCMTCQAVLLPTNNATTTTTNNNNFDNNDNDDDDDKYALACSQGTSLSCGICH